MNAGSIQGVDDHAQDRESSSFDSRGIGLRGFQGRQDARFYEFRNLHRVARGGGKGMLHACNQCTHFVFAFSPDDARACGKSKLG
jgi:hypothetical protein